MMKQWHLMILGFCLAGCGFEQAHFENTPTKLQIRTQPNDPVLTQALKDYHDPKGTPVALSIETSRQIESLNGMTHQQTMLAYTLTYSAKVVIDKAAPLTLHAQSQMILPVNQSIEEHTQIKQSWRHLAKDLAERIMLQVQQRLRYSLTTHKKAV